MRTMLRITFRRILITLGLCAIEYWYVWADFSLFTDITLAIIIIIGFHTKLIIKCLNWAGIRIFFHAHMIIHKCKRYRFTHTWTNKPMSVLLCTGRLYRDLYCCDPELPWGLQSVRLRISLKAVVEGLRRRRVAVIMQGQGIRAHLFIYILYHMRCYWQYIDLCLYLCMGS